MQLLDLKTLTINHLNYFFIWFILSRTVNEEILSMTRFFSFDAMYPFLSRFFKNNCPRNLALISKYIMPVKEIVAFHVHVLYY